VGGGVGLFDAFKEAAAAVRLVDLTTDVTEYLLAPSFDAAVLLVRKNPRLLTPEAIVVMDVARRSAAYEDRSDVVKERGDFLTCCVAEGGVDAGLRAFAARQERMRMVFRWRDLMEKVVAREWLYAGVLLRSHPELLSREVDELQGEMLDLADDEDLSAAMMETRELLRRAASRGSDEVLAELLEVEPDDVHTLVVHCAFYLFVQAETWEASREWLSENPFLAEADTLLSIGEELRSHPDTDSDAYDVHLAVLRRAREEGIDAAFESRSGRKQLSGLGLLGAAVTEMRRALRASAGVTVQDLLAELDELLEPTRARLAAAVEVDLAQAATMARHAELAYRAAELSASDLPGGVTVLAALDPYDRKRSIPEHLLPVEGDPVVDEFAAHRSAGYVATYDDHSIVAIRGTTEFADWLVNVNLQPSGTGAHIGFALVADWLAGVVVSTLEAHPGTQVHITGHSMGGAVAALLGSELEGKLGLEQATIWTFGAPLAIAGVADAPVTAFRIAGDVVAGMLTPLYMARGRLREHLVTRDGIFVAERSRDGRLHETVEAVRDAIATHPHPRTLRMVLARARDAARDPTLSLSDSAILQAHPHTYFPRPNDLAARHSIATYRELLRMHTPSPGSTDA
jgi:hypothetical protein